MQKSKIEAVLPSCEEISSFRRILLRWYRKHGRSYPWRKSPTPFHMLIAEMMLQRTKADQVVPVYLKLLNEYPTASDLAEADLSDLQSILNPLGLAWRISRFKEMAKALVDRFNGVVPEKREELTSLPDVGDYVAGAVLSIALQKPEWVVDSNIVRLFRRYFGIQTSSEGRRDAHVIELAKRFTSKRRPRETTLAILDFTSLVCTPALPRHDICPLKSKCVVFNTQEKSTASDDGNCKDDRQEKQG